jgi:MPBQ/MSBQ methyltransferase
LGPEEKSASSHRRLRGFVTEVKAEQQDREIQNPWERHGLSEAILAALAGSRQSLDGLTIDDLVPLDQFHGGGKRLTVHLAQLAGLKPDMQVLDVGGGLGGAARTLAVEFGCRVTVLDLTEAYIEAGRMLTSLLSLDERVSLQAGDALQLPFGDSLFDVVWTQNSGMNIADKGRLYSEFHRILRPGGVLAIQEPMAGPNQPPLFPLMWSRDGANHFLRTPEEMRALIEAAGFRTLKWVDVTGQKDAPRATPPAHTIQSLVMGDELLAEIRRVGERNEAEKRLVMHQAVFDKPLSSRDASPPPNT